MTGTTLKHSEMPVKTHSNGRRGMKPRAIVVHHQAGNLSAEALRDVFTRRNSSAHYGIDVHGNICQYVDENDRAWTTGGGDPDNYAITMELANDQTGGNWHISDSTINVAAALCADICRRWGIKKLYYDGKRGTLLRHCDFQPTACPGPYFKSRTAEFCSYVNTLINAPADNQQKEDKPAALYRVQTGAYKNKANAEAAAAELRRKGYETIIKEDK